jgi:hypothetical protein
MANGVSAKYGSLEMKLEDIAEDQYGIKLDWTNRTYYLLVKEYYYKRQNMIFTRIFPYIVTCVTD